MSLREAVIEALSHGPVARKDLVKAVEGVGYRFTTRNPLNSIGSVLYGKDTPVKNREGKFYVEGSVATRVSGAEPDMPRRRKRKRTMSPEARARIAEAQRARWARQRARK
jgi:hypothetical protein